MATATGVFPATRHTKAAVHLARAPDGDDDARDESVGVSENPLSTREWKVGSGHAELDGSHETPRGAAIGAGNLLDNTHEGTGVGFRATERQWNGEFAQASDRHRRDQRRRKLAFLL